MFQPGVVGRDRADLKLLPAGGGDVLGVAGAKGQLDLDAVGGFGDVDVAELVASDSLGGVLSSKIGTRSLNGHTQVTAPRIYNVALNPVVAHPWQVHDSDHVTPRRGQHITA